MNDPGTSSENSWAMLHTGRRGFLSLEDSYHGNTFGAMSVEFENAVNLSIMGLAIAIDTGSEEYASEIEERCRKNRLLVTSQGRTVLLLPALNIDQGTAKRGLDILERAAWRTGRRALRS